MLSCFCCRFSRPENRWNDEDISEAHPYVCSRECEIHTPFTISACFGTREFTLVNDSMTYQEAQEACLEHGMVLAGINDRNVHNFLGVVADSFVHMPLGADIWIGKFSCQFYEL